MSTKDDQGSKMRSGELYTNADSTNQGISESINSQIRESIEPTQDESGSNTVRQPTGPKRNKKGQVKMIKPVNFMGNALALDTDAINEMWNYGGEQGQLKNEAENEVQDFEQDILEMAQVCLAAMKRERPTDPIVLDDNQTVKKSFKQKFGTPDEKKKDVEKEQTNTEQKDQRPNYFRHNFMVPQTMRGIKNLSLGVAIKQDKELDEKAAQSKNETKPKDYLMKDDNINEFIQESENEANDSE